MESSKNQRLFLTPTQAVVSISVFRCQSLVKSIFLIRAVFYFDVKLLTVCGSGISVCLWTQPRSAFVRGLDYAHLYRMVVPAEIFPSAETRLQIAVMLHNDRLCRKRNGRAVSSKRTSIVDATYVCCTDERMPEGRHIPKRMEPSLWESCEYLLLLYTIYQSKTLG